MLWLCFMHRSTLSFVASLSILFSSAIARADEEPAPPPVAAPIPAPAPEAARPKISIAIERAGGVGYTHISAKDSDAAVNFTAFAVGGLFVNPYAAPRVGVDYILDSGITLGAAASIGHYSLSGTSTSTTTVIGSNGPATTTTSTKDQDVGSLTLYTLAPRIGYRIPISEHVDLTPRGGITLAGGSVSSGSSDDSFGVFALALSGEGVLAYRMTPSFNLLAGGSADFTVAATASQSSGSGGSSSSSSQDVKGGVFTLQAWLGLGGYL